MRLQYKYVNMMLVLSSRCLLESMTYLCAPEFKDVYDHMKNILFRIRKFFCIQLEQQTNKHLFKSLNCICTNLKMKTKTISIISKDEK